jgi:hypothetical protein
MTPMEDGSWRCSRRRYSSFPGRRRRMLSSSSNESIAQPPRCGTRAADGGQIPYLSRRMPRAQVYRTRRPRVRFPAATVAVRRYLTPSVSGCARDPRHVREVGAATSCVRSSGGTCNKALWRGGIRREPCSVRRHDDSSQASASTVASPRSPRQVIRPHVAHCHSLTLAYAPSRTHQRRRSSGRVREYRS